LALVALSPGLASADALGELTEPFRAALEGGSYGAALAFVFVAGLATSLTPCVYPMIAITVSIFGARTATGRGEAALLSTAFVVGIAAMFTPLGMLSALTGQAMGGALTNPFVVVPLALLFLLMAASMFGGFSLDLPQWLKYRLTQVGGAGVKGAFGLGFAIGLVPAPCTGPARTVLLTW